MSEEAHSPAPEDDQNEEEYIDANEVEEQVVLDESTEMPVDDGEDDGDDGDYGLHGLREVEGDDSVMELVDDSVQGFFAHKDSVYSVDMHPKHPNIIVTGGGDDKAYLWNADNGQQLFEFGGHTDSVSAVAFSALGDYVATGGMDGKICLYKSETGEFLTQVEGPDEVVWMNWHPKGNVLLAGATDSTIWMWAMPSGTCMNVFSGHAGPVTAGMFTPDGKKIVSVSEDASLIVWDPKTAVATLKLTGEDARFHSEPILSVAVSHDSALAITGGADGTAKLINLYNGNIVASLENHGDSVETVAFCDSLPLAATGGVDGKISIWDVTSMRLRQDMQHEDAVVQLKWQKGQPFFTSASADRTVKTWDGRTGACVKTWMGHQEGILQFAMSDDGTTVVTAGDDHVSLVFKMN